MYELKFDKKAINFLNRLEKKTKKGFEINCKNVK